jgi:hypothetical protein
MKNRQHITKGFIANVTFFAMLLLVVPSAHALDGLSADNIQAAMRTLSFLESLPKHGPIGVGVIYPSDIPTAQALAAETAKVIVTTQGPNSQVLQAVVLSTNDLVHFEGHLDVLFLVMGSSKHSELILGAMERHHLVRISDDPSKISGAE